MFAPDITDRICVQAARAQARMEAWPQVLVSISQNRHSRFSPAAQDGVKPQVYRNCTLIFPEKYVTGMTNAPNVEAA